MSIPFLLGCSAIGAPEVIVCTGGNCTATSGGDDNIPIVLFANLPVTPRPGDVRFVSNTNGAGCNGSGATMLECMWNGSAWVPTGTGSITTTGGDVFGPASSGNGKSAVFSGTSGKLLAQSTLTGLIKEDAGLPSVAIPATDYLTPTGSAAGLTSSPTLNQNTTGNAATATIAASVAADSVILGTSTTGNYVSGVTSNQGLAMTGGEDATLGLKDCAANEILKRNSGDTSWDCAADSTGGSPNV